MNTRWKIVGAAVAAGLVLVIGTSVAVAASGERGAKGGVGMRGGPLTAAASYLGLTVDQLREALRDDKSLAQVAGEQGKSVDGLKQAIRADAEQKLGQPVTNGRITEAQKQDMLERLDEHLDDLVNRTGPPMRGECRGPTDAAAASA